MSDFLPALRGVRQGCPLSTYLFIKCFVLLSYKITTTEGIKGITYTNHEFRKSLFADDASIVLDGSQNSFETLVDILDNYSNISGLNLNSKMPSFANRKHDTQSSYKFVYLKNVNLNGVPAKLAHSDLLFALIILIYSKQI